MLTKDSPAKYYDSAFNAARFCFQKTVNKSNELNDYFHRHPCGSGTDVLVVFHCTIERSRVVPHTLSEI